MKNFKKSFVVVAFVLCFSVIMAGCNQTSKDKDEAEEYPEKPIDLLITTNAGGSSDSIARQFSKVAQGLVGETMLPDNRPGGGGIVASQELLKRDADGYSLLPFSSSLAYLIAGGDSPFKKEDFVLVSTLAYDNQALASNADSPFRTFEEFVSYAEKNPGLAIAGGGGIKGTAHVLYLKIKEETGLDIEYVPYDGSSEALAAVLSGDVSVMITSAGGINQYVDGGELNLLAITGTERDEDYKDSPTFDELGLKSIQEDYIWRGIFAHADTPKEKLDHLNAAFKKAVEDDEWITYLDNNNLTPFYKDSEEATKYFYDFVDDAEELFKNAE